MDKQSLTFSVKRDIIYRVSHWEFEPPRKDNAYYHNLWIFGWETGLSLFHDEWQGVAHE